MKYAIILAFPMVVFSSHAISTPAERVFTDAGYPYKNLIMKAEKVELIYSEEQDKTTCQVNVYSGDLLHQGEAKEVPANKFLRMPVQSCLSRENAKRILSLL
ncbi:hypothetical protein [Pseudoalteromonas peptidolytica]|uniref:Uncharacterized protein n=1 Tax=Pseudoalteromonas peptidolytica F12-50-A1 TaxID=1315280 RepID=A0A8I0T5U2_9GAMM|nr:hypothetical protein [Pseudoalteromonas peptidolytica]MBE0348390.1 hypothetical protein [Pseudoalteromonas peptidolytica F12-50-A1]NLR14989.1 hypothetical protein [Pseudoalteromonas peptidolytica]GEK11264.1 hypothetical protein PPE03_35130 [Pseudoalteromonas peptidolytica]